MENRKKVLVTLTFDPVIIPGFDEIMKKLTDAGFDVVVDPRYRKLNKDELIKELEGCYAYIVTSEDMTAEVMDACPTLRIISRMGIGYDTVDVCAASERGIAVTITPGANAEPVAEFTLAMMMAMTRHVVDIDKQGRDGIWHTYFGTSMWRKTLGIIGMGNIGKLLAKLVTGFDMNVIAYDPFQNPALEEQYGFKYVSLEQLIEESDFISVHVPLSEETRDMISTKEIAKMKKGVQIVNCSRGGIVNEAALCEALNSGKVAGAALDVFDHEPIHMDDPLLSAKNLVLSTHTAGMTYEGRGIVIDRAVQNVIDIAAGEKPFGTVNKDVYEKYDLRWNDGQNN